MVTFLRFPVGPNKLTSICYTTRYSSYTMFPWKKGIYLIFHPRTQDGHIRPRNAGRISNRRAARAKKIFLLCSHNRLRPTRRREERPKSLTKAWMNGSILCYFVAFKKICEFSLHCYDLTTFMLNIELHTSIHTVRTPYCSTWIMCNGLSLGVEI